MNGPAFLNERSAGGYDVWLTPTEAVAADAVPLRRLSAVENSVEIDVAELGLEVLSAYTLTVRAFNPAGHSEALAEAVMTDEDGLPSFLPTPPTIISVIAAAGGTASVTFEYLAAPGSPQAEEFRIVATGESGQGEIVVVVPATSPRVRYQAEIAGPDGLYLIRVYSVRGGAFQAAVSGRYVRLDSSPPVGQVSGLTAV